MSGEKFTNQPIEESGSNLNAEEAPPPAVAEDIEALHRLMADRSAKGGPIEHEREIFEQHRANPAFAYDIELYRQGIYPTIEELEHSFIKVTQYLNEAIASAYDAEERATLEREVRFFAGRTQVLKSSAFSYADSVAQFHRLAHMRHHIGADPEDQKEKFLKADSARRRRHDALIDSLIATHQHVQDLVEDGYIPPSEVLKWDRTTMMTRLEIRERGQKHDTRSEKITVFNPSVLNKNMSDDRRLVQQWALAVDVQEIERELMKIELKEDTSS